MSTARKIPQTGTQTLATEQVDRVNAALREGGIDYRVEPGATFGAKAFTEAALKRWSKVAARLAE